MTMKNALFPFFFLMILMVTAQTQVPQAFKYQAVVRDAAGQVLANQNVALKINVIADGTIYAETHQVTTNAFGLVNLEIGRGTVLSGDFSTIDWSQQTFIQILLDATGGANYQVMGFSELLSVPYALYAANGGPDADADPANELELPANPEAGDMAYYDGATWQRIPKGKGGQILTLRNNGTPVWNGLSTDSLLEVTLPNGALLYVHPTDNSIADISWGPFGTDITALPNFPLANAAILDFNGKVNTMTIVSQLGGNGGTAYAAKLCDDLVAYGFDDWYLPAAGELNEINQQLGPNGSGQILQGFFWSSSERDGGYAWGRYFESNSPAIGNKTYQYYCRCVRR